MLHMKQEARFDERKFVPQADFASGVPEGRFKEAGMS
jgi:hypothetical protein